MAANPSPVKVSLEQVREPPPDDLAQQPLRLLLERQDVRPDLFQSAQRLRLVEVPGEADLVAGLHAVGDVPGIGGMRQHLATQESLDAAFLQQGDLLGVTQVRVALVLDHRGLAADRGLEQAAERIGGSALLVDLLDDRRCILGTLVGRFELLDFGSLVGVLGVDARQAQGPLDGDLPVAEGSIGEDLRLLGLLEGEKDVADALDVLGREFAVLLAEVLAQGLEPLRRVNELHLAPAVLGLAVRQHPDVGGDAGVVEHVERQGDDRFQPVVLDDPAADVALALARVAGEER